MGKLYDLTNELLYELGRITTWTEGGKHFTSAFLNWEEMERRGLITVYRPLLITGTVRSQESWQVAVTVAGQHLVDGFVQAHPELYTEEGV